MGWGVNDYPTDPETGVKLTKKSFDEFLDNYDEDYLNTYLESLDAEDSANLVGAIMLSNDIVIAEYRDRFHKKAKKDYDNLDPHDNPEMFEGWADE